MRLQFVIMILGLTACQQPGTPGQKTQPEQDIEQPPVLLTPEQRVKELEKLYTLKPMRVYSTEHLTVYRAQGAGRDTLVGVASNGEFFEGMELLDATSDPVYVARYALGVTVSPKQHVAHEDSDGYLDVTEDPRKIGDLYQFDARIDDEWMRYTWNPRTKELSSTSLMPALRARHAHEVHGERLCASKGAYCGCWPSDPCLRVEALDASVYAGEATHRRMFRAVGNPDAYMTCNTYACSGGECLECFPAPMPCTASCQASPRPYSCRFDDEGSCTEFEETSGVKASNQQN